MARRWREGRDLDIMDDMVVVGVVLFVWYLLSEAGGFWKRRQVRASVGRRSCGSILSELAN